MAFCVNCGQAVADNAKFCACCGTPVGNVPKEETTKGKTVFDGDLHKCPNCGEQLNAFVTICPVCNYELRGVQDTSCVHELSQKLEKTESDEQKAELISNFYIPNTKEDIYEFFILAYSNIVAGGYRVEAWSVKLEQAYLKAKFAFGNSEEFRYIHELYENIKKFSKKKRVTTGRSFKAVVLLVIGAVVAIISLLASELLPEFGLYMYDALYPIFFMGFACFTVGLVMFVIFMFSDTNQKKPKKKRQ